jgi:DNA-binding CsgD family transcriptional regulator
VLKEFRHTLMWEPDALGFSAHWAWIWCLFWSSLFYKEGELINGVTGSMLSLEPLWTISLLSNVITLALLLVLSYFRQPLSSIKILPVLAAIFTCLGTLLISHPILVLSGVNAEVAHSAGALLTGIGSAVVVVLWGELFATLGARKTIAYNVLGLLVGGVAYFLITSIPSDLAQVITALLPLASMAFFLHFKRRVIQPKGLVSQAPYKERPPYRFIGISLFFGISFGIMKGLFVSDEGNLIELRNLLNIIAIALASVAIHVSMNTFRMDFDHLTYQIALPLMATGFIFLPLHDPFNIIGTAVHQLGYQYFYIILWALWPVLARRNDVPAGWIVCWGILSVQLGQFLGSTLGAQLQGMLTTDFDLAMFSAFTILVILLIALFALGNNTAATGWGFLKPVEESDHTSPFVRICTRMARSCKLSPRETEVFMLLAKGRNRAYISADMVVSSETVKTHTKSIYRKMNVHSQQEIIDIIEQEAQEET